MSKFNPIIKNILNKSLHNMFPSYSPIFLNQGLPISSELTVTNLWSSVNSPLYIKLGMISDFLRSGFSSKQSLHRIYMEITLLNY